MLTARDLRRVIYGACSDVHEFACTQTLPFARVKKLMKEQDDVKHVSAEAVFLVGKATVRCIPNPAAFLTCQSTPRLEQELLLQALTEQSEGNVQQTDRKTLLIKDMGALQPRHAAAMATPLT
jgi:hypothetical protein